MSASVSAALTEYATQLHSKVACATARYYLADVRQHLDWLIGQGLNVDKVTDSDLRQYVGCLSQKERQLQPGRMGRYSPSTIVRKVSALREFYAYLLDGGQIAFNPATKLKPPSGQVKQRAIKRPAPEVVAQRLATMKTSTAWDVCDQAVLVLAMLDRLKAGEICNLNIADVDLRAGMVWVSKRRGRRAAVYLSQLACQSLARWLAARKLLQNGKDTAVFISLHWTIGRSTPGKRISKRGLQQVLFDYRQTPTPSITTPLYR